LYIFVELMTIGLRQNIHNS